MSFDLVQHLENERSGAIAEARELLWENIEDGFWWPPYPIDEETVLDEKISILEHHWHPVLVKFRSSFGGTLMQLEKDPVHEILQYGGGRRLASIYDAVSTISNIAYCGREAVLSEDEKRRLDDALMLFYVHVVGFFDSLAIAFHRKFLEGSETPERNADLLSRKYRNQLNIPKLHELFDDNDNWFSRVKDDLRNRYVHRIPPYVAPTALNDNEAAEFQELDAEVWSALVDGRFEEVDALREKQASLGRFFAFLSFTEDNTHLPILSTVLDDAMRFQVLALSVFEELVPKLVFKPNT